MLRLYTYILCCISFGLTAVSCAGGSDKRVSIYRLDDSLARGRMPGDSLSLHAAETLFRLSGYPELTPQSVAEYAMKPSINSHAEAVSAEFADVEDIRTELGKTFANMRNLFPEIRIPEVFTIISPFNQSIIVSDSMLFIGLNHYLGADYAPYGYFPDYLRRLKVRDRIPVDVAEALIRTAHPFSPAGDYPQALARMVYEGSVADAVMRVTGQDEAAVLGYDKGEYEWMKDNEAQLWNAIVERRLLFSTDRSVIRSLVEPSPHTAVISPDVPGRAGRFIGHRLMRSYSENHPEVSYIFSLDSESVNDFLTKARYNP